MSSTQAWITSAEQRAPRLAADRLGHDPNCLGWLDEAERHGSHHRSGPIRHGTCARNAAPRRYWRMVPGGAMVVLGAGGRSSPARSRCAPAIGVLSRQRAGGWRCAGSSTAGAGQRLETAPAGFWCDLSWLALAAAGRLGGVLAVDLGLRRRDGRDRQRLSRRAAVIASRPAGDPLPGAPGARTAAGTWLMIAPWLVGYGGEGGPVGLSDTIAGLLLLRDRASRL